MPDSLSTINNPSAELQDTATGVDWHYILTLLAIMLLTGLIGGYANFLNSPKEERSLARSLMMGIVATIAIPLFLKVVDSNILNQTRGEVLNYFIYAGCCVLAAFYSARFLEGLSSRILQNLQEKVDRTSEAVAENTTQLNETTIKADQALENQVLDQENMEPVVTSPVEEEGMRSKGLLQEDTPVPVDAVTPLERIEKAFIKYRSFMHTAETLSKATGLSTSDVKQVLNSMEQNGKVAKVLLKGQEVYSLKR
jgi:hypothetical protein